MQIDRAIAALVDRLLVSIQAHPVIGHISAAAMRCNLNVVPFFRSPASGVAMKTAGMPVRTIVLDRRVLPRFGIAGALEGKNYRFAVRDHLIYIQFQVGQL